MSPQDGAFIMMQTNLLCKLNYSDAYLRSDRIVYSFVECYFMQLVQIFGAKLIQSKYLYSSFWILRWGTTIMNVYEQYCHFKSNILSGACQSFYLSFS